MTLKRAKIWALRRHFPGYPPYDPEDDIMNRGLRVEGNLDDGVLSSEKVRLPQEPVSGKESLTSASDDTLELKGGSNLTKDDLEALDPKELSLDMNDDEQLKHRATAVDFAGKDLDVPGSELDDSSEEVGSEDEENNSYSIGGDNHLDMEEPRP